jgi:hypothetical protein
MIPAMILKEAWEEIEQEQHREAVEAAKVRLRKQMAMPWWQRLIPFKITIQRRTDNV